MLDSSSEVEILIEFHRTPSLIQSKVIIDSAFQPGQYLIGDTMRYKFQGKESLVILKSMLPKISDTKMGHIELADFWKMMSREDKSPM